jgi:hypothetical protein
VESGGTQDQRNRVGYPRFVIDDEHNALRHPLIFGKRAAPRCAILLTRPKIGIKGSLSG